MGDLILFRCAKRPARASSSDGGAQILFYTGVRYQRLGDDAVPAAGQAPDAPQRDGGGRRVGRGRKRRRG